MSRRFLPAGPLPSSVEAIWRSDFCRDFVENLPVGICICDTSNVVIDYNRCAAKLWGRAPVPGDKKERYCGALKLFHPDGMPLSIDNSPTEHVLKTGEALYGFEMIIERPDGTRLPISANLTSLFGRDGTVTGVVLCFQDITSWKKIVPPRDSVRGIEKRSAEDVDQMVMSTAHDLGSQLATIMLNLNLIENRISDPRIATFVGRARRVAQQSALMVRDLLGSASDARKLKTPMLSNPDPETRFPAVSASAAVSRRPTILLVDDDVDLCAVAIDSLEQAGYKPLHAPDGNTALKFIHSKCPIDLLLIDYRLLDMNGLEVIKRARAIRPDIKILMMTGQADISRLLTGYDRSIPLLRKPFRAEEFSDRIHDVMLPPVKTPLSKSDPFAAQR